MTLTLIILRVHMDEDYRFVLDADTLFVHLCLRRYTEVTSLLVALNLCLSRL